MIQYSKEEFGMIWVGIGIGIAIAQAVAIIGNVFRLRAEETIQEETIKQLTARLCEINAQLEELSRKDDDQD